jgi:hypothetical protein
MVKLQFRKKRIRYKRKAYEYDQIVLTLPRNSNTILKSLRGKQLNIKITQLEDNFVISLSESAVD